MRFTSARERRLWTLAAAYLAAIYGSAYSLQFILEALRARDALRGALAALAVGVGGAAVAMLVRRRAGRLEWLVLALAAVVYCALALRMPVLQERLHLLEYGVLAVLLQAGLRERWGPAAERRAGGVAVLLTGAAGWVDELIQGVLPNRVYDLRDVALNTLSGALALLLVAALRWARATSAQAVP